MTKNRKKHNITKKNIFGAMRSPSKPAQNINKTLQITNSDSITLIYYCITLRIFIKIYYRYVNKSSHNDLSYSEAIARNYIFIIKSYMLHYYGKI